MRGPSSAEEGYQDWSRGPEEVAKPPRSAQRGGAGQTNRNRWTNTTPARHQDARAVPSSAEEGTRVFLTCVKYVNALSQGGSAANAARAGVPERML